MVLFIRCNSYTAGPDACCCSEYFQLWNPFLSALTLVYSSVCSRCCNISQLKCKLAVQDLQPTWGKHNYRHYLYCCISQSEIQECAEGEDLICCCNTLQADAASQRLGIPDGFYPDPLTCDKSEKCLCSVGVSAFAGDPWQLGRSEGVLKA